MNASAESRREQRPIAIACSGLGHVRRGNETWAQRVAEELHKHGAPVTLFGGGPLQTSCPYQRLANLPREAWPLRHLFSWDRRYLLEQFSFGYSLGKHLRRGGYDFVQIADPILALRMHKQTPKHRTRVIYKDGLLLGAPWCQKFDNVQVLAPYYRDQAKAAGVNTERWFVIPHLVDTEKYQPAKDRQAAQRRLLGEKFPDDAFVILAVGDMAPASNKRLDFIIEAVAGLPAECEAHLLIAGSANPEQERDLVRRVPDSLRGRIHVFANRAHEDMPELYHAADVFAHAALREPFGIVFLEAMASGLAVAAHDFAVTRWIVGPGGATIDMQTPGGLTSLLASWRAQPNLRQELGMAARARGGRFCPGQDRAVISTDV